MVTARRITPGGHSFAASFPQFHVAHRFLRHTAAAGARRGKRAAQAGGVGETRHSGREAFNASAEALCDLLDSSGVFDPSNDSGLLDSLLHQIDELRNKLD
jgi:hypothetical protein